MESVYWYDDRVVAVVANGDEGDGIRKGDLLLMDVETLSPIAVVTYTADAADEARNRREAEADA